MIEGYNIDFSKCPFGDVENSIEANESWTYEQFVAEGYQIKPEFIGKSALFDYVYGCRMGNGAPNTKDGSTYKGLGFIHLTGKDQYKSIENKWNQLYPNDTKYFIGDDVILLSTNVDVAMRASMIFWKYSKNLNEYAKSESDDDIKKVTYRVNGGYNALDKRIKYTKKAYEVLKSRKELN